MLSGEKEFEFAIDQIGTDHLVFGTNFGGWDKGTLRHVDDLSEKLNANAVDLLRLNTRAPHLID